VIILKSPLEIERMRRAGRFVAEILQLLRENVRPGVTTKSLNDLAEYEAARRKAKPAFKGYSGYPYSLCCSPNCGVVHGMPSEQALQEGDILSLDFGLVVDGFYGDAAITVPVGTIAPEAQMLLDVTEKALGRAVTAAIPGNRLHDVSHAVQSYVEMNGFSVVRDFVGHGIGRSLHESPQVPNFGKPGTGPLLKCGMVLAIEPMINQGKFAVTVLDDGWTAVTADGSLSAHFEHTVAITENGPEILTRLN
jgi:methionyl aminopeptidase